MSYYLEEVYGKKNVLLGKYFWRLDYPVVSNEIQ